jgi:signal transduction histidine kinase
MIYGVRRRFAEEDIEDPLVVPIGTTAVASSSNSSSASKSHVVMTHKSVADSGVGLTQDEHRRLFQKFSQASPRTCIECGVSELGLFTSRALVEFKVDDIAGERERLWDDDDLLYVC